MAEIGWFTKLSDSAALDLAGAALDQGLVASALQWSLVDQGSLGLQVSLGVPAESTQSLLDLDASRSKGLEAEWVAPAGQRFGFEDGLLALLRPRAGETSDWAEADDECLLLFENIGIETAGQVLEELTFAATQTRIAASTSDGKQLWLFHLKDDPLRKSTLQGLLQSGRLPPAHLLSAFQADRQRIFFPPGTRPERNRFRAVCKLWSRAGRAVPETGLLLAIHASSEQVWHCLWLSDLRFVDQAHFQPAPSVLPRVELLPLVDASAQIEQLQRRFSSGEAASGYALTLQPSSQDAPGGQAERLKLREQRAHIEQRLAYLRSLDQSFPVLYRIPQSQLERLARLLSEFPVDALHSGELHYAFAADEVNPGGCHFIWVDADSAYLSLFEPMERYSGTNLRHTPDPLWAASYYSDDRKAQLFVPEGLQLFPHLHAWDAGHMDQYLADCVQAWQHASGDATPAPLPARPLYLFRQHPDDDDRLHLQVLDRDGFAPLHSRLGWINDNLLVTRDVGIEPLIQSMADATTRMEMLQRKEIDAGKAAERFQTVIEQVDAHTLGRVRSTLQLLTDRVEQTVRLVAESRYELAAIESSLSKLQRAQGKLNKTNAKALKKLELDLAELPVHLQRSHENMENLLARAEQECARLDQQSLIQVEQLGTKRSRLVLALKRQLGLKRDPRP